MTKHWRYLIYVLRHKWYVFIYGCQLGIPWLSLLHDNSKFVPAEWFPYSEFFYLPDGEKRPRESQDGSLKEAFLKSFEHHWMRNKHHWQYWCAEIEWLHGGFSMTYDEERVRPMPDRYRREMLADWRGAGRAINGVEDARGWYAANRDKIVLHPETRQWIEQQLSYLELVDSRKAAAS